MEDHIELKIKKFELLSKRKDVKKPSWFALPNNVLLHPDFLKITGDEFKVFIWILGTASQLNQDQIRVYFELCARQLDIPHKTVLSSIEKLMGKRWDVTSTLQPRDVDVTSAYRYKTRQDTTEQENKYLCAEVNESPHRITKFPQFEFFEKISPLKEDLITRWLQNFGESFINDELKKAELWVLSNPKKAPKAANRFLNNWFQNNWERHRKTIPSQRPKLDYSKLED